MNENHNKDKKIKSKKKSKNLKIDLSDVPNTLESLNTSNTPNTPNTKTTKKKKPIENNKTDEKSKTNNYINNLTLECFMNASQYERYVKNNNAQLQNNNISNDDFVHSDEEVAFYKNRILNLLEKMFNKEFPNDTLKSIFNILINNSINYLQEQDTFDLYQENYDNVINDSKNKNISNMSNVSNLTTESIITSDLNNYVIKKEDTLLEDFVTKKKINLPISKSSSRFPKKRNLNLKTQELKNKGLK